MAHRKLERFVAVKQFKNCMTLPWSIVRDDSFRLKGRWNKDYFNNEFPITLELGCGKGEYTVALAVRHPGRNFIGVDIKGNRIWKGAKESLERKLTNVSFLRTRIDFIDKGFGPNEVNEIWITFPDPQKEKARKRLTHSLFLERYRRFLTPCACIHLKTDSDLLYEFTMDIIAKENGILLDSTNDLYENKEGREDARETQTFYEKIYLQKGRKIKYLKFRIN